MRDLTQGSVTKQILAMALPITVGMVVQTLYLMVDLYFVASLGSTALAGVNAASNVMMLVMALTQMLSVGTVALIARAVGARQTGNANLVFNQALLIALLLTALTLGFGYWVADTYMTSLAADDPTRQAGIVYLHWYLPGLALMFVSSVMGAALRGTGIVKPTMVVQMLTVLVNIILTPIMTAGWLTGYPLGVMGAAFSSTLAVLVGVVLLAWYFLRLEHLVKLDIALLKPNFAVWKQLFNIGLPSGGEFLMLFASTALSYWVIKDFGSQAQAAYGVGSRLMQFFFMPAMAVSFALPAIVGQNLGAGQGGRIREALNKALLIEVVLMTLAMLLCQWQPQALAEVFTQDPAVLAFAEQFLAIISFIFVASGINFTCSSFFQGMGNTWPALFTAASRLALFAAGAFYLAHQGDFALTELWHWSVWVGFMQAALSYVLARREMARKLPALVPLDAQG
ncbi:MAG: MATE family efflux transporter [Pseudomonadota bacterium]|uniref:MATE family efflux transporter n=1 Tax=Gallaecimonas pentaromativorans TaxID=584787 RepID=UPI00067F0785|nr:MATE family efflux transporter [Gallaecimonas pentaromativorans]MED5523272.1 MATE family efflux transporter [Pseudomonadota bacterium]